MKLLLSVEICAAPVYDLREAANDPHNRARGMVATLQHPKYGPVEQVGIGPKLSATPGAVRTLPPLPGENTDAVLAALGHSAEEIAQLRTDQVVG